VNARDLALVGVRIVAVFVAAQFVVYAPVVVSTILSVHFDLVQVLSGTLFLVWFLIAAVLLWILAPRIASLATDACSKEEPQRDPRSSTLVVTGLILLGAYLLATTLPRMVGKLPRLFAGETANVWAQFVPDALICTFALLMVFGATGITRGILALRQTGLK